MTATSSGDCVTLRKCLHLYEPHASSGEKHTHRISYLNPPGRLGLQTVDGFPPASLHPTTARAPLCPACPSSDRHLRLVFLSSKNRP